MRRFLFTLLIAFTTRACVVQANPGRLGGYKWSFTTTTTITGDEDSSTFNSEFAKRDEDPERPFYLNEDNSDARFSVAGNDDRYKMPPLAGDAEDFIDEAFVSVNMGNGGRSDRYKMPPVYSVQDLYDMKNGKKNRGSVVVDEEESEEGEFEEE